MQEGGGGGLIVGFDQTGTLTSKINLDSTFRGGCSIYSIVMVLVLHLILIVCSFIRNISQKVLIHKEIISALEIITSVFVYAHCYA